MKKLLLGPLCLATAAIAVAHPCAELADGAARLACYDQAFPPRVQVSPAPPAKPTDPLLRFGLPPDPALAAKEPAALSAKLSAIEYRADGARLFLLDNGQRWLETDAQRRGVTNAGDAVEIKRGSFGSFMLVTPARVGIRVRRLS